MCHGMCDGQRTSCGGAQGWQQAPLPGDSFRWLKKHFMIFQIENRIHHSYRTGRGLPGPGLPKSRNMRLETGRFCHVLQLFRKQYQQLTSKSS